MDIDLKPSAPTATIRGSTGPVAVDGRHVFSLCGNSTKCIECCPQTLFSYTMSAQDKNNGKYSHPLRAPGAANTSGVHHALIYGVIHGAPSVSRLATRKIRY